MELENKKYMQQGIDLKRLVLVLGRKLWLLLAGILLGAILGGITYEAVTSITNGEPEFQANADYYITFNFDEFNYGADYYNAYTWDGILRDDPIVDYALTLLPAEITKDMVKAAVSGEMLGDYRILTVHVKAETEEKANLIAQAYQESLWHFGQEIELLESVALWSQEEAVPYEKNNKTANAAFLGACVMGLLVYFVILFYYVLEDACYVEKDAWSRFNLPVYGLLTKGNDEMQKQIMKDHMDFVFGTGEVETWNGEMIPTAEDYESLRKTDNLLVMIPWGRNNGRQVERVLTCLSMQKCEVKGLVITDAKDSFVKAYYAIERRKRGKS
ncbi:MAG: hypothetical protein IKW30_10425 [Lachnospiraceae bacterium]|nr:hypothetical protein [Lachnospiraceae bacterium]